MLSHPQLLSPRQVARAIGVGESTLKRWCDQGFLSVSRTAGGHRKVSVAEALRFVRQRKIRLESPGLLGLEAPRAADPGALANAVPRLVESLLRNDWAVARELVTSSYAAGFSVAVLGDRLLAPALYEIGGRWACGLADVFEERRACEFILRVLAELRSLLPSPPEGAPSAVGCTAADDHYSVATRLAELVLQEAGFRATSLGTSIPMPSLARAVEAQQPVLAWLSVSHIEDSGNFDGEFEELAKACRECGAALVVGGQALTPELRRRMSYAAFGDGMVHLAALAEALLSGTRKRTARSAPPTSAERRDPDGPS
jgi:methanogenic corrinoid protein MtbC1